MRCKACNDNECYVNPETGLEDELCQYCLKEAFTALDELLNKLQKSTTGNK